MIRNVSIVFFHTQQPTAKYIIIDMKPFDKVQVEKHSETRSESLVVLHVYIVKLKIVQLKMHR